MRGTVLRKFAVMAALALAALPFASHGDELKGYRFQIVTGDDSEVTNRIAADLYKQLSPVFAEFRTELAQRRRNLTVAIGPAALHEVAARRCDCAVISAFTSSQVVRSVLARLPAARAASFTAVYAEPAPADQLRLIALLYGRPVRIAAIAGPDTSFLKPALQGQVTVQDFSPADDINRVLSRIAQAEVLLALPDNSVYNSETIRNVLLSTYRHKQAVIGFSADMVKAGALATTYSEVEDVNAQVAEMAAAYVRSGVLPPPQFPRYFRTVVNEGVARSLDVRVTDDVRRFERKPPGRP
ncbi:MAG TPA: hypothetical protein VNT33_01430 [Telluria sp.]|nr:hypothetical protein [Telluria sp.]